MKRNSGAFLLASRWGVGVAVLALLAFTSISRASVVTINNTGNSINSTLYDVPGNYIAEQFQTGIGGNLTSLALQLDFTAADSANVYISTDLSTFTLLGAVTSGTIGDGQVIALSLLTNPYLAASTSYLIVLEPSDSNVGWDFTYDSASGGDGTLQGNVYSPPPGGVWNAYNESAYMQMELTVLPEVPKTGMIMGLGALAIVFGRTVRRKLRPAVASIV